ncbi:MAG: helix-turn-helix domain-containing protein [Halalkalicoccus sp.]|nr:helix-turn-helix domain-containing protein [Halalkalicoccus sp.]
MDSTVSKPPISVLVRTPDQECRPRGVGRGEYQQYSCPSLWVGSTAFLQFTPGIDCLIALLIGLLGGMLAGMALARVRVSDEPSRSPAELSRPASMSILPPETTTSRDRSLGDDPVLTDEDRIVRLLASNDGRMKQSRIVDRTDWSKAKVSRLLSGMEESAEITKLTVGRENIIFLGSMDEVYASDDGSDN